MRATRTRISALFFLTFFGVLLSGSPSAWATSTWTSLANGQKVDCVGDDCVQWADNDYWSQKEVWGWHPYYYDPKKWVMLQPSNWTTPSYPDGASFDAVLGSPASTILDIAVTVGTLTVQGSGLLDISNGQSLIVANGLISNASTIGLNSTGAPTWLRIDGDVSLSGGGQVNLTVHGNNIIRGVAATDRLTNVDNTIQGLGQIGQNAMSLTNQGVINANDASGNSLVLDLSGAGINDGIMRASSGGKLDVYDDFSGTGRWEADGGKIQINTGVNVTTTGRIDITKGGELELNNASMTGSDLFMDSTGILDINSTVSISGNLSFAMTDETYWGWGTDSILEMTGGVGAAADSWADWAGLEIGGYDFGIDPDTHTGDPAGFSNNFELEELVIGAGAHVYLMDLMNNANRGGTLGFAEALYVDALTFADVNGVLNLNDLNIYYNTLNGNTSQIISETAVPAPSTLMLLGSALAALIGFGRRRFSQIRN